MLEGISKEKIKKNTQFYLQGMEIEKCRDTVCSIGAIAMSFQDQLSTESILYLQMAQAIIQNMDLSYQNTLILAKNQEINDEQQ